MTTRYSALLENQTTLRLNTWLSNVKFIKEEYENGTHGDSILACKHCIEAGDTYYYVNEVLRYNKCSVCIWQTLEGYMCGQLAKSNNFCSSGPFHNAVEHIARCDRWIDLIQTELNKRIK
ncbi:MAG: hypothetical protein AB7D38_12000 [Sulfurimonas sp.]|uniref:hypothetical protein n=1 Tax=Sulfurimonas sp. TaxID=2022749 RepID=UPI003D0F7FD4